MERAALPRGTDAGGIIMRPLLVIAASECTKRRTKAGLLGNEDRGKMI